MQEIAKEPDMAHFFKAHINEFDYKADPKVAQVKAERIRRGEEPHPIQMGAGEEPFPMLTSDIRVFNKKNFEILGPIWFFNMRMNSTLITEAFADHPAGIQDYVAPPGVDTSLVALVSSGPTLDKTVEDLRDFPGLIMCGVTALSTLLGHGVKPHIVGVVDFNGSLALKLRDIPKELRKGIKLFATPHVSPAVLAEFPPEDRYFFHSFADDSGEFLCKECGARNVEPFDPYAYPMNTHVLWTYPEFFVWILQMGCIGNALLALVGRMQATLLGEDYSQDRENPTLVYRTPSVDPTARVLLYGYDYGYPKGQGRATYFTWDEGGDPRPSSFPVPQSPTAFRVAQGCMTDESMIAYKRNLLVWWFLSWHRKDMNPFYLLDVESRGIINEVPKVTGWKEGRKVDLSWYDKDFVGVTYASYQERCQGGDSVDNVGDESRELREYERDLEYWKRNHTI